jgi:signal transduction histidine kinase
MMDSIAIFDEVLILFLLKCSVYLLIIFLASKRFRDFSSPVFWLWGYASFNFGLFLWQYWDNLAIQLPGLPQVHLNLDAFFSLVLCIFVYQALLSFLGKKYQPYAFWGGIAGGVFLLLVNEEYYLILVGLTFTLVSMALLMQAMINTHQYLHLNRLYYWAPVLIISAIGDLSQFYFNNSFTNDIRLTGLVLLSYVVMKHRIPDMRDFLRILLIYLVTTLVSMGLFIGGFSLLSLFFGVSGYISLLVGAGIAVLLSLLYPLQIKVIRRGINRIFGLQSYDPARILSTYGASISNILDLEKLALAAFGVIEKVFEVDKGYLFLVDPEIGDQERTVFRVSGARGMGLLPNARGVFSDDSPLMRFFLDKRVTLLQYDIDFAPWLMNTPAEDRHWFSSLVMDVYVPIFYKSEWIGLLALGSKPHNRYTDEDLRLLEAIASQTAVALENARLVENLKLLNQRVSEAYADLDKTTQALAKLEKTKSNFISIASHELRSPLTAALGYTEMMLEAPGLPDGLLEMVAGVHKSLLRQHEIIDSMFDLAQLDARSNEFQPLEVSINEILRSVAEELSIIAAERSQLIMVELPQLPYIKADPDSLRKLFHHLLMNAIKFTPNGGTITLSGSQLAPNTHELPDGGVEVVVQDTGVGVDRDLQDIIFTKFYQPDELLNRHSTGKTKFMGSGVGLGLALSRGIVEAHGGRIWVESLGYDEKACPGSKFHVVLPLRPQGESSTARMSSAIKLRLEMKS